MDSNEKVFGVLGYIGILFLIPLLAGKTEFSRFHANQGLVLFIVDAVASVAATALAFIPFVGWIASSVLGLAIFILAIMGIVNAAQGEMKPLPVIGGIQILK